MTSEEILKSDGCHGLERPTAREIVDTLAATLSDTGVLDGFTWRLRTSARRRTVGVTIERDATVTVTVPAGSGLGQLVPVLRAKRPWMIRRTAERAQRLGEHPVKQIVTGENFPYLGRSQRLLVRDGQAIPVRRRGGRLCLRAMPAWDGARAIIDWYTRTATAWLDPRISPWAGRVGISPAQVRVSDPGRRWGTAKPDGEVTLHWALFQLRPVLVDYVLVHELVHLAEPRHGPSSGTVWTVPSRVMRNDETASPRMGATSGLGISKGSSFFG